MIEPPRPRRFVGHEGVLHQDLASRVPDLVEIVWLPIFIAEIMIGRAAARSPVGAFQDLAPAERNWKILGWSCALASLLILSYYSVVAGWSLNYTLMSLLNFTKGKSADEISSTFDLLYVAGDMNLLWNFIFLGLTTAIVFRGIRKGIEFWSKILMPFLFIILVALFIYGTTLDGFSEAFSFIFSPDAS